LRKSSTGHRHTATVARTRSRCLPRATAGRTDQACR
jgi:hypothetical protein